MKDQSKILADLIATTPGEEGAWFATTKDLINLSEVIK
jgi:hypothetical protein